MGRAAWRLVSVLCAALADGRAPATLTTLTTLDSCRASLSALVNPNPDPGVGTADAADAGLSRHRARACVDALLTDRAAALSRRGWAAFDSNLAVAHAHFSSAHRAEPLNPRHLFDLALVLDSDRQPARALRLYDDCRVALATSGDWDAETEPGGSLYGLRVFAAYNRLVLLLNLHGAADEEEKDKAGALPAVSAAAFTEVAALPPHGEAGRSAVATLSRGGGAGTGGGLRLSLPLLQIKAFAHNECGVALVRPRSRPLTPGRVRTALAAFHAAYRHWPSAEYWNNHRKLLMRARAEGMAVPAAWWRHQPFYEPPARAAAALAMGLELARGGAALGAGLEAGLGAGLGAADGEEIAERASVVPLGGTAAAASVARGLLLATAAAAFEFAPGGGCAEGGTGAGAGVARRCVFLEIGTCNRDTLAQMYANDAAWRGASVEPLPHYLDQLPPRPGRLLRVQAAVGAANGNATFYSISPQDLARPEVRERARGLPGFGSGISSFNAEHIDVVSRGLQQWYRPRTVRTLTFAALMELAGRHGLCADAHEGNTAAAACAVDLLKIDTEGFDADIILQMTEWGRASCAWPRRVKFEASHARSDTLQRAVRSLADAGYFCQYSIQDVVCVATAALPSCAARHWAPPGKPLAAVPTAPWRGVAGAGDAAGSGGGGEHTQWLEVE